MNDNYALKIRDIAFDQYIRCKLEKTEDGSMRLLIPEGYREADRDEYDEILTINFEYIDDTLDHVEIIFEHDCDTDVILINDSLNEHLVDCDVFTINICKLADNLIKLSFADSVGTELVLYYKGNPLSLP